MNYLEIANTSYMSSSDGSSSQLLRGRFSTKDRYVVLAEFSEIHGPLPLTIIPNDIDKNKREEIGNFIVQVMAVDYTGTHAGVPTYAPADTTMLYQHTRSRISALVHYFNLHDVKARGYSRIFTLSFITLSPDSLFHNISPIKTCFEKISKVCHNENIGVFHSEMLKKRVEFRNDIIECRQINWWLNEMERKFRLPSTTYSEDELDQNDERVKDDLYLPLFPSSSCSETSSSKLGQSRRSLPCLREQQQDYAKSAAIQTGEESLRELENLVPIAYCFLERSIKQLFRSKGTSGSLHTQVNSKTSTLALGRYALQFPRLTFLSLKEKNSNTTAEQKLEDQVGSTKFYVSPPLSDSPEEGFTTFVGESTFYDQYEHFTDIDWATNETVYGEEEEGEEGRRGDKSLEGYNYDILPSPQLNYALSPSSPFFISPFNVSLLPHSKEQKLKQSVGCCCPKTIELDLFRFRHILKNSYKDYVFSVLSGRPVIILGNEEDEICCSFRNALSLFVTCPQYTCTSVLSELKLSHLAKYSLIQCKRSGINVKTAENFAQSGLCSVIHHDKRTGKAPRYSGDLIPKIWGDDTGKNSYVVSEKPLFHLVQSGLVSELAFQLIDKYYSLLLHQECSVEEVLGTSPEQQCDTLIFKFQILLLLNPSSPLLSSSHNPNSEFKYDYYDTASKFPIRFTS